MHPLPLALAACAALASPALSRDVELKEHLFDITTNVSLVLQAPADWRVAAHRNPHDQAPVFTFLPKQGAAFSIMVTPLPEDVLEPGFGRLEKIRDMVEYNSMKLRGSAPGSRPPLRELKEPAAAEVVGYYVELRDPAPQPDRFPFLIQGARGLPHLLLLFTVLTREPGGPEAALGLEMMRKAREALKRPG